MKKYAGEEFLNKIYKDLVNSNIVKHTGNGGNKNEDVHTYMERLERITKRGKEHDNLRILKQFYYDKYIIKPENIPESYCKQQEQIALDRGYGHVHYTDEIKRKEIGQIISEQKSSLDSWIDYFASTDTEMYPTWFKYYCFQGMVRLGYFDKREDKYAKRTEATVKPFIEINRDAIAMVYDELVRVLNKEHVDDTKLEELLKSGSFSKIYAYCIKKLDNVKKDNTNSDEGIWKKYLQGSDPNVLFNDIHGKGTGWCTAGGLETATQHLEGGDFYVYFTKDNNGEYTCPRIAIRMEHNNIAEIRGIAENQNLESNMEKVVDKKLEEFPDKEEYKKKCKDMEMLTYIYTKWKNNNNVELNKEELKFLYELDDKIVCFGYRVDPRIDEIINTRNIRKDLSFVFNCNEQQISLNSEEALRENIIYHHNSLNLSGLTSAEGLKLPEKIAGNLYLKKLTSIEGLKLPEKIGGLDLRGLTSAKNLKLPGEVEGGLDLSGLTSAAGLKLPEKIGGKLYLTRITSTEELKLPEKIGGLDLRGITSAKNLKLPEKVEGDLDLSGLISAEGLKLPEKVEGTLDLSGLTSAEGLKLPEKIGGDLYLNGLTSAEGLKLPEKIGGGLDLNGLTSAKDLKLPKKIVGLSLNGLTNVEGLKLPEEVDECLDLSGLTSAEGLKLPKKVGYDLFLQNLTSTEGLIIPNELDCGLDCPLTDDINILKQMCKENNKTK